MTPYEHRFSGIGRLYGTAPLDRFRHAHVCIVGIGGVGSWTVEALARSGVGRLTLVDLDDVCVSNTNRQLHAMADTVGRAKVDVMADRARLINPEASVEVVQDFYSEETEEAILSRGFDVVVDAIDHLGNKVALLAACKARGIEVVTVGGAGGRKDPTRITSDDLSRSRNDGLLRRVRRELRKQHGFPEKGEWGIPCVYTTENAVYPTPEGGVCDKPTGTQLTLDCNSGFGTATFVTGTFGFAAAALVLDVLSKSATAEVS